MTRDTVWQDDPPFAVGEPKIAPATDAITSMLAERIAKDPNITVWPRDVVPMLIARIKAERERFQDLRDNYKCGEEYEAGLWSRRNIEAFFRDQDKKS